MSDKRESVPANLINRRHIWLLLLATFVVQGIMFISYPLGTGINNDNESAQRYLIDEYAKGNFLVGNVRYNTGYALIMAPFRTLTDNFGRLADRTLLLLQMLAYSAIPFLLYDTLRRRIDARCALITALLALVDPFGLQWAHFLLPGWLIALATVVAFWLAQLAWHAPDRRRFALIALAAVGLGMMSFARFNFAPLVAVFGASFLFWRHIPLRQRITLFIMVGVISGGILGAYILLIHIPSTGTASLSCTAGATLVASLPEENFQMRASKGPHSLRYAQLLTLAPQRDVDFFGYTYPLWRQPGPWVSEDEAQAFFAQPIGEPQEKIDTVFPAALYWYMGPCAADALLYDVYFETVADETGKVLFETIKGVLHMLVQHREAAPFPSQYLDVPAQISWGEEAGLGFVVAESPMYNGHRLWRPGVILYSGLFPILNLLKWLTPVALVAALWRRDWLLLTAAAMLLLGLLLISAAATIEPRYYASMSPLFMLLIGSFIADLSGRLSPRE